eukprot:TRINITY_DN60882_c0_g1_i1.p1 TRINITY_DN60882_c0_g1~~TRINITY_DN60882_c0_g1_i1.p1  ORF type:complete len:150 (+),score=54.53 TRINITY_DN60882_c0_g1_i1:65-451(+)
MLRRCSPLLEDQLSTRMQNATILNTGGTPRINFSPQGIVYERKKKGYVTTDTMAIRRQRLLAYNEWRTMPLLYPLVDNGEQLYQFSMSSEQSVARVKDGVVARRLLKEKQHRAERKAAWEAEVAAQSA